MASFVVYQFVFIFEKPIQLISVDCYLNNVLVGVRQIVPWTRAQYWVKNNEADGFITVLTKEPRVFMNVSQVSIVSSAIKMMVMIDYLHFNELAKIIDIMGLK